MRELREELRKALSSQKRKKKKSEEIKKHRSQIQKDYWENAVSYIKLNQKSDLCYMRSSYWYRNISLFLTKEQHYSVEHYKCSGITFIKKRVLLNLLEFILSDKGIVVNIIEEKDSKIMRNVKEVKVYAQI